MFKHFAESSLMGNILLHKSYQKHLQAKGSQAKEENICNARGSQMPNICYYKLEIHFIISNHSRALCCPVGLTPALLLYEVKWHFAIDSEQQAEWGVFREATAS
ncbi:hypothetical protein TURU_104600 [Turdus rufiventris]|nr:hypothetical protein TURU_104600 [Turdus rufiventris]